MCIILLMFLKSLLKRRKFHKLRRTTNMSEHKKCHTRSNMNSTPTLLCVAYVQAAPIQFEMQRIIVLERSCNSLFTGCRRKDDECMTHAIDQRCVRSKLWQLAWGCKQLPLKNKNQIQKIAKSVGSVPIQFSAFYFPHISFSDHLR